MQRFNPERSGGAHSVVVPLLQTLQTQGQLPGILNKPELRQNSEAFEAELLGAIFDPSRAGSLRQIADRLQQLAMLVRDRTSNDMWRVLSQLNDRLATPKGAQRVRFVTKDDTFYVNPAVVPRLQTRGTEVHGHFVRLVWQSGELLRVEEPDQALQQPKVALGGIWGLSSAKIWITGSGLYAQPGLFRWALLLAPFGALGYVLGTRLHHRVPQARVRRAIWCLLLFNGALAVFVWRRSIPVSYRTAVAVLVLFIGACVTKEHAVVLPALLLLTDYFWNPPFSLEGIRRNWKLYAPIALGAVFAGFFVSRVLNTASTAGFGLKDLKWYEYFFSQCRAIWVYLRMFVLPFGQNADHEFAISRSLFDHGAIIGLVALIGVTVAAWIFRRQYPLASYGWFALLILIAPTSSFVPIRDLLVERRLYLPFLGLVLIACEFLRRWRTTNTAMIVTLGVVTVVFAGLAYQRNHVWGDPVSLWKDTAEKSPNKSRPRFQLGYALWSEQRCPEAAAEYEKASRIEKPDYSLYVDWSLALDCAQQYDAAIDKLRSALALEKSAHAYALTGMVYAKQNRRAEALQALDEAEKLDPKFQAIYVYRGNILLLNSDFDRAADQFRRAIELNPADINARNGLDMAQRRVTPRM